MSDLEKVNLLLVGRTGNGKSSTGNSILGRTEFKVSMNSQPFTVGDIRRAEATHDHTQITLVDGPGIGDASLDDPDQVGTTIALTEQAIGYCPDGFSAVLVVLKYGERFTKQEQDAVLMVKAILGSQVLASHVVIVMTRGDNFEIDQEDDHLSFKDWCGQQTGHIAEILTECEGRCVLFNNRIRENTQLDEQRLQLLTQVGRCQPVPYMKQNYDAAKEDRHRLKVFSRFGIMEEKNRKIVNEMTAAINKLDVSSHPGEAIRKLNRLESDLDKHKGELLTQTRDTGVGKNLFVELSVVAMSLTTKRNQAVTYQQQQEKTSKQGTTRQARQELDSRPNSRQKKTRRQTDPESREAWPGNEHNQMPRGRDLPSPRRSIQQVSGHNNNNRRHREAETDFNHAAAGSQQQGRHSWRRKLSKWFCFKAQ